MKRGEMRKEKKERKAKVRNKTNEKTKRKEEEKGKISSSHFFLVLERECPPSL